MMLCSTCSGIFQGVRPPLYDRPTTRSLDEAGELWPERLGEECLRHLHDDLSQLANGARQGCTICDITWRHFFRDKTAEEYAQNPWFYRNGQTHHFWGAGTHYRLLKPESWKRDEYSPDALELQIGLASPMDRDIPEYKDIALDPLEDEPAVDIRNLPKPDSEIYGSHTFQTVQKWLSDCQQNHKRCNVEATRPSWYPTRLLDLEYRPPLDRSQQINAMIHLFREGHLPADCRLIETSEVEVSGPYMTLSHKWTHLGRKCVTSRSNIAERKAGISAEELSQLFEDAVHFTRCMGVRYLWIDSLCIVQGDETDWTREATTMDRVYAHSILNIEATVGNHRLIQPRVPDLIAPCVVTSRWADIKSIKYVVTDFRYWHSRITRSVCNTRAWITQERLLAPRVLHFTFDQLLWECRELEAGETYPHGLTKEILSYAAIGFKQYQSPKREKLVSTSNTVTVSTSSTSDLTEESKTTNYATILDHWHKILLTYGRAELTYTSDRFVAISGVAAKLALLLDDTWVAGLWRKALPNDLLWHVDKTRRSNKPQVLRDIESLALGISRTHQVHQSERLRNPKHEYEAPSWSWASVLGDILPGDYLPADSYDRLVDIVDISITPRNPKIPLGRLKAARLTIKGKLYPLAMDPPDWTPDRPGTYRPLPPTIYVLGFPKIPLPDFPGSGHAAELRKMHLDSAGSPLMVHACQVHIWPDEPLEYVDVAKGCFLPIRKTTYRGTDVEFDGQSIVHGLVLSATGNRGEYERLGRANFMFEAADLLGSADESKIPEESKDEKLYLEGQVGVFDFV